MKKFKSSLFLNLFIKIAVILTAFVLVIVLSSSTLLDDFYFLKEKNNLISAASNLSGINVNNKTETRAAIEQIISKNSLQIEIYNSSGRTLYTTEGDKMMDFFLQEAPSFNMMHAPLKVISNEMVDSQTVFQLASDRRAGSEYLVVVKSLDNGNTAELKVKREFLSKNAEITGEFVTVVAIIFLIISLVWTFFTARHTAKPIYEMNAITKDMASLNFARRLQVSSSDEIGELAASINNMADSLSSAMLKLQSANKKLREDIELERRLDTMLREFVANVSHELKTPLSIISGYAEGLKLNINSENKDRYCETIIDECTRMNSLVLSILELSRYESGQMPINRTNFDISSVADTLLDRIFENTDIVYENNIGCGILVNADLSGTEQILKCYLENARSHTDNRVRIYSEQTEKGYRICVYNSGSQIEEDKTELIWQSFYRGDTSHKRENERFGLGLSIVAAICKMHGEDYGVFNTEDGVIFWFEVVKSPEIC